ncbi:hypothetical protein ADJ70_11370 [Olsenella sp. oral taxon 807]|nr:hypothetical protein ADJ70_11370 [Olsenella sp. oral taxon 807]
MSRPPSAIFSSARTQNVCRRSRGRWRLPSARGTTPAASRQSCQNGQGHPPRVPAAQQEGAGGGVAGHRGVLGQDLRGRLGHRDQARHVTLRMPGRDRPGAGVEVGHAQVAGLRAAQATRVAQTHRRVAGVGALAGRRRPGRAEHAGHLVAPEDVRGERAAEGAALLAEGHVLPAPRDQVFGETVGGQCASSRAWRASGPPPRSTTRPPSHG